MMLGRQTKVLLGLALLSFGLGSLHAFSVLLLAMEAEFSVSRSTASMTYSIALVSVAAGVLLGQKFYDRLAAPLYVAMIGTLTAAGCIVAAFSPSSALIWLGFGVVFGGANGLGYGYALQFSARALPQRKGFAMGIITAAFALGAVAFPVPLRIAVDVGGWTSALLFLAFCLLLFSALSAVTLLGSRFDHAPDTDTTDCLIERAGRQIIWLWLSYCGAVTAGLMVIGHATGLAESRGGGAFWVVAAPVVIASANMAGSLLGGILTDRIGGRPVLAVLAALSGIALTVMAIATELTTTMVGLAVVGFSYGGTIAAYPAYIAIRFGATTGTIVYARVFTAWAVAGLLGPSAAGLLFDRYQNYQPALLMAAFAAVISLALIRQEPKEDHGRLANSFPGSFATCTSPLCSDIRQCGRLASAG